MSGDVHVQFCERLWGRFLRTTHLVILCRKKSDEAMTEMRRILERLGLSLNGAKTKRINAYGGKFDFLGFTIWMGRGRRTGNYYPHVQPSKKSLQTIKDRVTSLTRRERTVMPPEWVVNEVNATVRGWIGYFHYRNCSRTLGLLRNHVEQRLITHLRKRRKVRDRKAGYVIPDPAISPG